MRTVSPFSGILASCAPAGAKEANIPQLSAIARSARRLAQAERMISSQDNFFWGLCSPHDAFDQHRQVNTISDFTASLSPADAPGEKTQGLVGQSRRHCWICLHLCR